MYCRSGKDECLSGVGIVGGVGGGGGALPVSPVKLPSTHQPTQATKVIFERNSNICSSHKGTVSSIMQGHDAYTPTANSQYITISIASMASQTIEENQSAESQEVMNSSNTKLFSECSISRFLLCYIKYSALDASENDNFRYTRILPTTC